MSIPIPTPPTDNLYKFVALLGAILLGFGLVTPHLIKEEFLKEYTDKLDRLNAEGRELQSKVDLGKTPDELRHSKEVGRSVGFTVMEGKNLEAWNRQRGGMYDNQVAGLSIARWVGALLAIAGTSGWWFRLQRYQDRQLRAETLKKEREMEPSATPAGPAGGETDRAGSPPSRPRKARSPK